MEPSAQILADLARKYRGLCELRRARDARGHGPPDVDAAALREHLRALAGEFPGCLRELDTLGTVELGRRAAVAARAAQGGEPEPWMAWIAGYHALMRAALLLKAPGSARPSAGWAASAIDDTFVAAVRRPPQGRLGIVVLRRLALIFGVPASEIAAALFPPRRPRPYQL